MSDKNKKLRNKITRSGFKYWEIAKEIGGSASSFSVWLRIEVDNGKGKKINDAIEKLVLKKND